MNSLNRHQLQREQSHQELRKARYQSIIGSSLLISAMVTIVSVGVVEMITALGGIISGQVFIPFVFFAAMETLYAKKIEKQLRVNLDHTFVFRLAEFILLAVILRGLLLLWGGVDARWTAFTANLSQPISAWFVPEYSLSVLVLFLLWIFLLLSYQDMKLLYNLEEFTDWEQVSKMQTNLIRIRQTFLNRFIFVGIFLLLGMIFSTGQWNQGEQLRFTFNGKPITLILVVMSYFFLLLLLMSQTQLARLRTRWWLNRSIVSPQVQRNWLRISAGFFLIVATIALLSPTGFAEGLFKALQSVLLFLMMVVQLIAALLLVPFSFLLGLLFPARQADQTPPAQEIPQVVEETIQQTTNQPPAWLDIVSSVLVWVVLGGVVIFALVQYLRQDRNLGKDIKTLFQRMCSYFRDLWQSLQGKAQEISATFQRRRRLRAQQRTESTSPPQDNLMDEKSSNQSRRTIFQLYRQLLFQGMRIGQMRKSHQTPLQYENQLAGELNSSAEEPLHALTETFDEARYSQHEVSQQKADQIIEDWSRLQNEMREKKDS